jgi:hypothetical protein
MESEFFGSFNKTFIKYLLFTGDYMNYRRTKTTSCLLKHLVLQRAVGINI